MNHEPLLRAVGGLFTSTRSRTRRIGIEQELITRDMYDGSVVSIDRVRRAAHRSPYSAALSFEPGGQVELSLPCFRTVTEVEGSTRATIRALRLDCAAADVLVESLPVDGREGDVPLQLVSPRYLGMQEHFDSIGPAGRRMMRRTASTQVCLDWWPGRAGLEQWHLMQLAGPFLASLFSRSAGPDSRLSTWLSVDPGRTAFDDRLLFGDDPVRAYVAFAAGADRFALPADPDGAVAHHLSTLFPPVRPRGGYLEVRYLDAQSEETVPEVAALLAILLYDDECRRRALRMLAGEQTVLGSHWHTAAHAPLELVEQGRAVITLCQAGVRRAPDGYLPGDVGERLRQRAEVSSLVGAA